MDGPNRGKRADRRQRTLRIARRRHRRDRRDVEAVAAVFGDRAARIDVEKPLYLFADAYRRHRCAKRRRGRPKIGRGICHVGVRDAVRARILSRRLCRALTAGRVDPDEVSAPRGFHGWIEAGSRPPPRR